MNRRALLATAAWTIPAVLATSAAPAYATSTQPTCLLVGCKEPGKRRRKTYHLYATGCLKPTAVAIDGCPATYDAEHDRWTLADHRDSSSPLTVTVTNAAGTTVRGVQFKPCKEKL